MIFLDTVMDALNALFPDLLPPDGGVECGNGVKSRGTEKTGKVEGEAGFARALFQVLGREKVLRLPEGTGGTQTAGGREQGAALGSSATPEEESAAADPSARGTGEAVGPGKAPARGGGPSLSPGAELAGSGTRKITGAGPSSPSPGESSNGDADGSARAGKGPAEAGEQPERTGHTVVGSPADPGPGETAGVKNGEAATVSRVTPSREVPVPPPADPDLGKLHPDFRSRLERVVERMGREYGHEVKVVEGHRSQDRQDALFQQGRTRPGSVVTWTRHSLHSRGRAADVQIDGTWDDPDAYRRLQKIAREEGLHTLGLRDQGHLELPLEGDRARGAEARAVSGPWSEAAPLRPADAASAVARPASVASPATPVAPARVARVARVASVGAQWTRTDRVPAGEPPVADGAAISGSADVRNATPTGGGIPGAASARTFGARGGQAHTVDGVQSPVVARARGQGADSAQMPEADVARTLSGAGGGSPARAQDGVPLRGRILSNAGSPTASGNAHGSPAPTSPGGTSPATETAGDRVSASDARAQHDPESRSRNSEGSVLGRTRSEERGSQQTTASPRGTTQRESGGARGRGAVDGTTETRPRKEGASSARERSEREVARNERGRSVPEGGDAADQSRFTVKTPAPEAPAHLQDRPAGAVEGARSVQRPDAAQRVAEIEALEKALDARLPGRVHLDLRDADGAGTRLRLALRGPHLMGSIDLADAGAGQRIQRRVGELHEALARRGLDATALGVQGARGLEARGIPGAELSSLLQESVQGITRLMESQEGSNGDRHGRQERSKQDPQPGFGRDRQFSRRNTTKEEDQ